MWKKINNHSLYFISFQKEDNCCKIYVTDYLNLWFVYFSETSFVDCLKESNPDLELNDDILRDKGIQMLSNPDGLKTVDINLDGSAMAIFISMSFGYTVNMNFKLVESSKEMFFQKVTQPLLKMIQRLQCSNNEIQQLIKKKDREINEYKSEGFRVARHLKTPKFDEKAHKSKYNVFEENFGTAEIPNDLLKKEVSLPEDTTIIKHEQIQVKLENEKPAINIKMEPNTPSLESSTSSTITTTANVKTEAVKTEAGINDIRKRRRTKLNL